MINNLATAVIGHNNDSVDFEAINVGSGVSKTPAIWWMTLVLFCNIGVMPLLGAISIPLGEKFFIDPFWWSMFWVHLGVFSPSVVLNALAVWVGKKSGKVTFIDKAASWFLQHGTLNLTLLTYIVGYVWSLILYAKSFMKSKFLMTFFLYSASGMFTLGYLITEGVEVL